MFRLRADKIKVRKADLIQVIENMDSNGDDYISVAEVVHALKVWKKHVKDTVKYLRRD